MAESPSRYRFAPLSGQATILIEERFMKFNLQGFGKVSAFSTALVTAVILAGCQTSPPKSDGKYSLLDDASRRLAAASTPIETTPFGKLLASLKLNAYEANLHSHHFMGVHGSKKHPMTLEEAVAPGPCHETGTYPMDDGHPCRDQGDQTDATIQSRTPVDFTSDNPDLTDYFRQACEYGVNEGKLDILFITPHTKNNGVNEAAPPATSTGRDELLKRQGMLASMNPDRLGAPQFLCGMGQEASSISTGNHVNVFGQFHAGDTNDEPLFFPAGDFKTFYSSIKTRNDAGAKIFLQFNHPSIRDFQHPNSSQNDLFWGKFADLNPKQKKTLLNDYGMDDFAPMGCLLGKLAADAPECKGVTGDTVTSDLIQQSYANARAAAGDVFRLIEVVPPGADKEGEVDTNGDGSPDTAGDTAFGATTNTKTNFRAVQHRTTADTYEEGVYNWVFYLSMGFKLGPTADQDNHHANWGSATASRTGILATDLKEESVLSAMRARHVYASEDVNAKVMLSQVSGTTRTLMGGTVKVTTATTKLEVSYYDPDSGDATAKIRLYYYRDTDPLDFTAATPNVVFHTVSFDAKNAITLPAPTATDRSKGDLIPIRSGEVVSLTLPVVKGNQWVFAEIIQDGDLDKSWTAPIWITKP
jgi:hypothetical protein